MRKTTRGAIATFNLLKNLTAPGVPAIALGAPASNKVRRYSRE
jgi:hypothetical protein